ncbi:MAG: response regulator transcription factor [Clostridia bacterium]|nr:response regulator transcription factor [Clostridia bacterium]
MEKFAILVCDDDKDIVRAIKLILEKEEFTVYEAYDGEQALDVLTSEKIRLVLIDVMMPKMNGMTAVTKIREKNNIPGIFLSAKSETSDKILGLSVGADDYITKPFDSGELIARVRSQLRRYTTLGSAVDMNSGKTLVCGGIVMDTDTMTVTVNGDPVKLTATELKIIQLFMENQGVVMSSERIYDRVWGEAPYNCENTVMVHIRRIREKIEIDPKKPEYLKVVWGVGYKLEKH